MSVADVCVDIHFSSHESLESRVLVRYDFEHDLVKVWLAHVVIWVLNECNVVSLYPFHEA